MRRTLTITFVIFGLLSNVAFGQMVLPRKPSNHLKDLGMAGNVKSMKITSHMAIDSFGTIYKGKKADYWRGDVLTNFDKQGYKFDALHYDTTGKLNKKVIYKYNNNGANRKRTVREEYGADGKMSRRNIYLFDAKGNKVGYRGYNSQGVVFENYTYKNNSQGQEIEEICLQTDHSSCGKYTYEYYPDGKILKLNRFVSSRSSKPDYTETYTYDKDGRILETTFYQGDRLVYKTNFEYDKNGNILTQSRYDRAGALSEELKYDYTFDKKGNWIERTEYVNGIARYMVVREITY